MPTSQCLLQHIGCVHANSVNFKKLGTPDMDSGFLYLQSSDVGHLLYGPSEAVLTASSLGRSTKSSVWSGQKKNNMGDTFNDVIFTDECFVVDREEKAQGLNQGIIQ